MAKQKATRYISPKGIAVFPKLNEPDTKFKATGEFTTKLAFEPDDADYLSLVAKLTKIRDEAFEAFISENPKKKKVAKKADIGRDELDAEGEETGRKTLTFKMNHKVTAKATGKTYTLKPDIFDSCNKKLENPPQIGGGSTLRVSFEVFPAYVESSKEFHLSLRMVAVKIIDLVTYGARGADDYGFDDEDEGTFEAEAEHTTKAAKAADAEEESGEEESGDGDY